MKNNIDICSNCKNFDRYYVLTGRGIFRPTNTGYCRNASIKQSLSALHKNTSASCEFWEEAQMPTDDRSTEIERKLKEICSQLQQIVRIIRSQTKC